MTLRRARWILVSVAVLTFALFSVVAALNRASSGQSTTAQRVPAPLAVGTELQRPRPIPNMKLVDSAGRPFSLTSWRGKYVVLAPSMTLCQEVCPITTGALNQLVTRLRQAGLAHQVVVAEVTVDPGRDTPARLRAYQRMTGVKFELLTGTEREIDRLWTFFGVVHKQVPEERPAAIDWMTHRPETYDVDHTDGVFFIDPHGQERIVNEGMPAVGGRLSAPLRRLLDAEGLRNLARPELPWTAADALDDIDYLMNRSIPAALAPHVAAPTPTAIRADLADSPHPLADLHRQAGQLLGSESSLGARLRSLRGYPVVINIWASWCPACRAEFPLFAQASARNGRQVAFVGVDVNDSAASGRAFLARHNISYPSYGTASDQLGGLAVVQTMPITVYVGRDGKVVARHLGQYQTLTALENDIDRYARNVAG